MNNIIKSDITNQKIIKSLYIAVLPLLLFGYYKNGIMQGKYLFPLLIDIIGFTSGLIVNLIKKENVLYSSFYPFYGILIASMMPSNCNIYIFTIITFLGLFISSIIKKKHLNIVALIILILTLLSTLTNNSFLNIIAYENQHMDALDYLLGKGNGGINTTCNILCILSYIYLYSKVYFKKEITIYSLLTYCILLGIYILFKGNIADYIKYIFEDSLLFVNIFVATEFLSSPYTTKGKIIYGILIGIFTFGLFLITPSLAPIGAVLLASIIANILDKIVQKRETW